MISGGGGGGGWRRRGRRWVEAVEAVGGGGGGGGGNGRGGGSNNYGASGAAYSTHPCPMVSIHYQPQKNTRLALLSSAPISQTSRALPRQPLPHHPAARDDHADQEPVTSASASSLPHHTPCLTSLLHPVPPSSSASSSPSCCRRGLLLPRSQLCPHPCVPVCQRSLACNARMLLSAYSP